MTYPTFADFLTEHKDGKLMHLTHLEDILLDDGAAGLPFIADVLDEFGHMLSGGGVSRSYNLTTKWDGAPSVVFGVDPADKRFFVATKSAFNKTPKLMKSHTDINQTYGEGPGVGSVLMACFTELALLQTTHVLQGDLLFSQGGVKTHEMEGKVFVTFRPNTIMYAVEADSQLGATIRRATLGIVVHTMYTGKGRSIEQYRAAPITPTVFSSLRKTPRVLAMDAQYDDLSGSVTFTDSEEGDFTLMRSRVQSLMDIVPEHVMSSFAAEPFHTLMSQYLNQQVRTGTSRPGAQSVRDLITWLTDKHQSEQGKRSSDAGKTTVDLRFQAMMRVLLSNVAGYARWFELHTAIMNTKTLIVRKLGQVSRVRTFLPTPSGYRVTGPEGFVAVSHSGRMVKLVDRLEFSRANFLAPKEWA